jgi:hypothetical protein
MSSVKGYCIEVYGVRIDDLSRLCKILAPRNATLAFRGSKTIARFADDQWVKDHHPNPSEIYRVFNFMILSPDDFRMAQGRDLSLQGITLDKMIEILQPNSL